MKIGYLTYVYMVAMFFVVQVFNNYAFDFNVPVPLHMIVRSVRLDFCWYASKIIGRTAGTLAWMQVLLCHI